MKKQFTVESSEITDQITLNQELTRSWIAKKFAIAFIVIVFVILGFFIFSNQTDKFQLISTAVMSPLVGIFGVVIGFYFGKK